MNDSISYVAREAQHYEEKQLLLERIYRLEEKYARAMENAKILSEAVTKLERERDAAIRDMGVVPVCAICIHNEEKKALSELHDIPSQCINCVFDRHQFVWRGLCAENGGEE